MYNYESQLSFENVLATVTHTFMYIVHRMEPGQFKWSLTHTLSVVCNEGNRYRPLNNSNWLFYDRHFFAPLLSQYILAHHEMVQSMKRLAEMSVVKRLDYINISCKIVNRHRRRRPILLCHKLHNIPIFTPSVTSTRNANCRFSQISHSLSTTPLYVYIFLWMQKKMKIKIFVLWGIVLQNEAKRMHIAFQRFIILVTIETQHANIGQNRSTQHKHTRTAIQ